MNEELDIETLKQDKEFLENLERLEKEVQTSDSLAKAYQLLDVKLAISPEDEEAINELFQKVVEGSFETIASKIDKGEKLDLSNPEEWAAARGIYEHAIQKYSENDLKAAKELFLALYHTIDDFEIKEPMMVHAAAVEKGYSFDDFLHKLAKVNDADFNDPKAVFITNFAQPVDILQKMLEKEVTTLKERLKKLEDAQKQQNK